MNIFVTDSDPVVCARNLDDRRVNKMIIETAQLLSTAVHLTVRENVQGIYKPCYVNHPCAVWARKTRGNFDWLVSHGLALCATYTNVYQREHATYPVLTTLSRYGSHFLARPITAHCNCTPHKDMPDVIAAYKRTMIEKWDRDNPEPTWHNRGYPDWSI